MQTIQLPSPVEMSMPFSQVLGRRRSRREFSDQAIDLPILSALLWASAGRTSAEGLRTVPSSMDSREVECFVFDKAGVWFYNDETNALELVSEGDKRMATTAGQDFVGVAPVTLVFAVNQKKLEKIDPGHAGEIMKSADVGAMMQNALLACSAMGLAAVPRVWFDPQAVLDAMGKTMAEYEPQKAVTVGFAA